MAKIQEILSWFELRGNTSFDTGVDKTLTIRAPKTISEANEAHISFINKKLQAKLPELLKSTKCKLILIEKLLVQDWSKERFPENTAIVLSDNPKIDLIDFCKQFLGFQQPIAKSEIHPSAVIDPNVKIGKQVKIGPFVHLEENVEIGDRCSIGANSVIKKNTQIGDDVEIGSCTVIGGVGFGYAKKEDSDEYEQFPHYGGVIIKNKVSIGSNTAIDQGSLSDTIIEDGVKIDNLVHIAHNVRIGKNSVVIACSMIAGSVVIGENCWVAPAASVRNGLTIGKNTTIGISSTVTKDVLDGQVVIGSPAILMDDFFILRSIQKEEIDSFKKKPKKE